MKLEIFEFIDESISLMNADKEVHKIVSDELKTFFLNLFAEKDYFLNIHSRIKSPDSLREKILRNNFYLKYGTPVNMFHELSDLLGVRVECRFIEDEEKIFMELNDMFTIPVGDGFFTCSEDSNILLKLDEEQPQFQRNGFEIYKIDGCFLHFGKKYNFELQIKSMVNVFWGDIDHRILYKNYKYMITEDFLKDMMKSIRDNLALIDRQLKVVYDQINNMDSTPVKHNMSQLNTVLSKSIHDIYMQRVRDELGFVIDFKKTADVIVNYLLMKDQNGGSQSYADNFLVILNRLNKIEEEDICFNCYLQFENEPIFVDNYTRAIGSRLLSNLNMDFSWSLFFRIIFDLQEGTHTENFESFVVFLRYRFSEGIRGLLRDKDLDEDLKEAMRNFVLENVVERFCRDVEIDFIDNENIGRLNSIIKSYIIKVDSKDDWIKNREKISEVILNYNYKK